MDKRAFFFAGNSLIMPDNILDSQIDAGLPVKLTEEFKNPDIFEVPAIDEENIITAVYITEDELPVNWKSIPVRQLWDRAEYKKIIRAFHIAQWRRDSRFCGTCGAENRDVPNYAQRHCPVCGRHEFPRICPAVIVLITDSKNRILLAHNKSFKEGIYSHISGFNEAGETLEETVVREIREEVNIEVKNIEYIKSQAWPFPNSLMVGFKAQYACGELKPDGREIEDANWFTPDNLPGLPGEGSLSRWIINEWLEGKL
ncbi:MAG: NAD(+) diphosphatase [Treponema sp.]|nr:NAD(+) diphosphatase [Treponema sp.]